MNKLKVSISGPNRKELIIIVSLPTHTHRGYAKSKSHSSISATWKTSLVLEI